MINFYAILFASNWKFLNHNFIKSLSGTIIIKQISMDKKTNQTKEILKQQQSSNNTKAAERAAEADIKKDLDLTPPNDKGDDLDEGELARLEGEK